ncbi:MAG: cobalamin-dependent protein [Actinobacteria bacterium]|nr:cobalamin-dependent protein [Actinomycetota bacterium]
MPDRKIKVLLSKLGLDVHNRGVITVAKMLRDAGMEVIYLGNALPEEILGIALQEHVDVIGVSSLGGAHITLGMDLINDAVKEGIKGKTVFIIGGVFSIEDEDKLKEIGFDGVYTAVATRDEIINSIKELVRKKAVK